MSCKIYLCPAATLCALVLCTGCGADSTPVNSQTTKYEVGDETSDSSDGNSTPSITELDASVARGGQDEPKRPAPMNQTAAAGGQSADVVQPTVEQIVGVMRRLRQQQPKQGTEEEVIADFVNIQTQVIQAAEMLLGMNPEDDAVREAAEAKIEALSAMSQLGTKGAMDQLFAFTDDLKKHQSKAIQAFASQQAFVTLLNAFSADQVTDAQQVIDAYKQLAAEQPKEGGLLTFGRDVSSRFIEKGNEQGGSGPVALHSEPRSTDRRPPAPSCLRIAGRAGEVCGSRLGSEAQRGR